MLTMTKKETPLPKPERTAVTTKRAAEILGVTSRSVINYYEAGDLEGYKKGLFVRSAIMIYVDSLERFMKKRREK
jgi:hypothetical protein